MTRKRKFLMAGSAALVTAAATAFFVVIPHEVDRRQNGLGLGMTEGESLTVPPLHQTLNVVDLHADTLLWDRDLLKWGRRGHVDLPRLQQGNVALQVFSVVTKSPRGLNYEANSSSSDNITVLAMAERWPVETWDHLSERALYQARRLREAAEASNGQLRLIRTRSDLEQFLAARGRDKELVGAILSMEGAHALEGDLTKLDAVEAAGFRVLAPTHLFDSDISGAQAGVVRGGLTELGRQWVAEMDRRSLIIDLAHASSEAIDEILKLSRRPQIVSHTGVKATCKNNRNLSDDQIRRIAEKGGLIGIGFWTEAICGTDLNSLVRSLRHTADVAGVEHVALGSDWDGFVTTAIDSAHLGWLTAKLQQAGFSDEDIRRLMGDNALQFFLRQLPP